jgi:chromate transporter
MTIIETSAPDGSPKVGIRDLINYFLRLGLMGFGGPVALVGQMEKELVDERKWLTREQIREAVAVCQSLSGPLAIQVGIFISYLRGGFWGAWAGGWAFIFPNFLIVAALGALYVYLGDLKPVTAICYGVSPAVIALILHSNIVAIHQRMSHEQPRYLFLHYWGKGKAVELARSLKRVLEAQSAVKS